MTCRPSCNGIQVAKLLALTGKKLPQQRNNFKWTRGCSIDIVDVIHPGDQQFCDVVFNHPTAKKLHAMPLLLKLVAEHEQSWHVSNMVVRSTCGSFRMGVSWCRRCQTSPWPSGTGLWIAWGSLGGHWTNFDGESGWIHQNRTKTCKQRDVLYYANNMITYDFKMGTKRQSHADPQKIGNADEQHRQKQLNHRLGQKCQCLHE